MAERGLRALCCVLAVLCVGCQSLLTVAAQDSREVPLDDAASAKADISQDDGISPQDANETVLDDDDVQPPDSDHQQDLDIDHQQDLNFEGEGEGEEEGHRQEEQEEHEEEEGVREEEGVKEEQEELAEREAAQDAQDASLPDVIDEAQDDRRYARILEIDRTVARQRTHDGDYAHPFHQPNIVENVMYTYRRFRKMKLMRHGKFWMGTNDPRSETGEYPVREMPVRSFYLDVYPVINAFYWAFRAKKRFARSEAEIKGWSWVTDFVVSDVTRHNHSTPGPRGWLAVKKARWDQPEGPDSNLEDRWTHPVVHLSWYDAKKFCEFHGKRLPTEQEWEYAARAGLIAEEYPWGDRWQRRRANTWQGKWPGYNSEADGYKTTSPVDAYKPQNIIGMYDMIGNVWEWTHGRYYERLISHDLQGQMHVLKGASFVDSMDGQTNLAVRNGQRSGKAPDYTSSNIGFRCARSAPEMGPHFQARKVKKGKKERDSKKPRIPKIYRKPKPSKDEL